MNNCPGLVITKMVKSFNVKLNVLASVVPIGMVLGGLVGGYLAMRCGPKKMMQVSCLVNVLGFYCCLTTPGPAHHGETHLWTGQQHGFFKYVPSCCTI